MKISQSTNVQMPLKTVVSLITLVSVGTWAYFGVIARLTQVETELVLTKKDLIAANEFIIGVPKGDMVSPQINELYMLVEFISGTQEGLQKEITLDKEFFGVVITPLDTHLMSAIIGLYFGGSLVKK